VEDVAYANDYTLILCNSDEDPTKEALYIKVMRAELVAGILMTPATEVCPHRRLLTRLGVPIAAVDRQYLDLEIDTVVVDNVRGAYEAVSHLIELGHSRIGLISGPSQMTTGRERRVGYEKALAEHGLEIDPDLIREGNAKQRSGFERACELLEMENRPTALFVGNNLMTLGALNAIHEQGLCIPEDIAIVGFDDMSWAASLRPPLTVVAQPVYELGSTAAKLLLDRIQGDDSPIRRIELRTDLVVRESCGA